MTTTEISVRSITRHHHRNTFQFKVRFGN